jgi:hypothetical protein
MNALPENCEVVTLSEAISHPLFNAPLRDVIFAMAERPGDLSLDQIVTALGMDPVAVAERFVSEAISTEILRIREIEAAGVKAVH